MNVSRSLIYKDLLSLPGPKRNLASRAHPGILRLAEAKPPTVDGNMEGSGKPVGKGPLTTL